MRERKSADLMVVSLELSMAGTWVVMLVGRMDEELADQMGNKKVDHWVATKVEMKAVKMALLKVV